MPKPNCTGQSELDLGVVDFGRVGRREVQGCFDGGSMTSDGGVMLLSAADRKLGLTAAAARCIADPRNPLLITHAVRDMLRQRVYGLALGWEDLNDHQALRCDVAMQTAVGVDREVASAPTLCRLEKWADRATALAPAPSCWSSSSSPASRRRPRNWCWTSMPPTTRCTVSRRDASSTATTTATATCRCTCSAASNCCAPTCAPAASMGPSTPRPS